MMLLDSRPCKLSLQLIFVALSKSTMIALSFLELAEEDCFGYAYVFHPCDMASPARSKVDSMLGRLALSRTSSFDT